MAIPSTPRSVSDATRFTATTPHASSKSAEPRFNLPRKPGAAAATASKIGGGGKGGGAGGSPGPKADDIILETPEQKVARLRAAHQRAKLAKVSRLDKFLEVGRKVADSGHRLTVVGLIGLSGIAALVTVYTAFDMMAYNKKRKAEWIEAQKKLEADSLEAARIAYMTGKATEDQIALVEEQLERERRLGQKSSFFDKMPSIIAPDSSSTQQPQSQPHKPSVTESVSWPSPSSPTKETAIAATTEAAASVTEGEEEAGQKKASSGGLWSWMTANLKKEEEGDESPSDRRLGYESLSEEDDGQGVRDSDIVRAVEHRAQEASAALKEKAHAAFEKEKENERKGGPLDRIGLDAQQEKPKQEDKKKRWFW
ncbi:cytochrome oxidase c assembly-domain-containing protein [Podospora australis]|uniref:Cytochrome oxidase c assembly-domain-containing protein n=1 Tax=Podospora australis TaxID=1536484 RepID=A0AAN6WSA8_9PEZI|nr:cytochrome oxidase c assembly-domain-containing protein [Podospora australis]